MSKLLKNIKKKQLFIYKPDILFESLLFHKFVNKLTRNGKKFIIETAIRKSFTNLKKINYTLPIISFYKAMSYIQPVLSIVNKRRGKHMIQTPVLLTRNQQISNGIKMIVSSIRKRNSLNITKKISEEFTTSPYNYSITNVRTKSNKFYNNSLLNNVVKTNVIRGTRPTKNKSATASLTTLNQQLLSSVMEYRLNYRRSNK